MKRITIILLVVICAFSLRLYADTTAILLPHDVYVESQVNLSDTIKSDIHVTYVDVSKEEWSWYKILSLLVGLLVPLSSVWLAWKINRDNNEYNLTKHKQEMQDNHDENLHRKKMQKQGEILEALNTLDSRFRSRESLTKKKIKKVSDQVLIAYPYIGKEMYDIANQIIRVIEQYVSSSNAIKCDYTTEDDEKIVKGLAAFINKYNDNVNTANGIKKMS